MVCIPTKISSQVIASLKLYLLLQYPSSEPCCNLEFTATRRYKGKRLSNHVLRIANVEDQEICEIQCFIENNCFSYNIMTRSDSGNQRCELNNATHEGHERDLKTDTDYVYQAAEVWGLLFWRLTFMITFYNEQILSLWAKLRTWFLLFLSIFCQLTIVNHFRKGQLLNLETNLMDRIHPISRLRKWPIEQRYMFRQRF